MRSLESCEWLVLEKEGDVIAGAAGMGGTFHVSGIQINEIFRGKGIGKKIQKELIDESEKISVFNIEEFEFNTMPGPFLDNLYNTKKLLDNCSDDIVFR